MRRMSPEERRRQFVGIGLAMLVDNPDQELSLDEVAQRAEVSRGLLFHYFPTRADFLREVVAAGGRRVLRNLGPDEGLAPEVALAQVTTRLIAQIQRRRTFFVALLFGRGVVHEVDNSATAVSLRNGITDLVLDLLGHEEPARAVVHAWVAYVEDRAIESAPEAKPDELAVHCLRALHMLLDLH